MYNRADMDIRIKRANRDKIDNRADLDNRANMVN